MSDDDTVGDYIKIESVTNNLAFSKVTAMAKYDQESLEIMMVEGHIKHKSSFIEIERTQTCFTELTKIKEDLLKNEQAIVDYDTATKEWNNAVNVKTN